MKDRILVDLFRRQHGAISRGDALAAGLTRRQIVQRVKSGVWLEPKPGVYRNAAAPVTPEMLIMEAVLSAGPNSAASHQSAAYLWGMLSWSEAGERAAVSVPSTYHPRAYGFDVHRTSDLDWARVHPRSRIECTDPMRTLVDLAGVAKPSILDSAVDRSLSSGLVTIDGLESEIRRRSVRGRNGVGILRERLRDRGFSGGPTASALELRGIEFLRKFGLPLLEREVVTGPDGEYRIDFVLVHYVGWELDGYAWHFRPEHKSRDE
ncbi:MAG TPA: type IV toxin-antitoxin system AbiEi family antitoxin domain-containing protein, partial [Acidimicrobiales bacterium]|nr:type IV toxin-antitoxin system AbiEi family antitoxin domain-containing protein [Acidimicrobiales bacterium]